MKLAIIAIAMLAPACVDTGSATNGKKIDRKVVQAGLVKELPADLVHLDVALGGMVTYVGNKPDRPIVAPGQSTKIVHYWRVDKPPGPGWRVFAFVRGQAATADFMNLDATDMQLGHPVESWKAGELIADTQDFVLRPDWKSRTATLYVGLVQVGGHDAGDRMAASGANTLDRAIIAKAFDVDLSKAPPPQGTVYIPHANGPIAIDGVGMDQGWATAASSPEFQTGEGCPEPVGKATAKMTWDDDNLYVFVQVTDSDIYSEYKKHDDPLWKQDAVELFIDADGNRRGYVELQVNPNNATFDSWFATTRAQPGDESWTSGMVTAVKVRGTPDVAGDTDSGWDAEIAIPWATVKGKDDAMQINTPPHVGDRWRMNIVRVDTKTGSKEQSASSWNRITCGDFHALDRMLTVVFADNGGSIVAKPVAPPEAGSGSAGSGAGSGTNRPKSVLGGPTADPAQIHKLLEPTGPAPNANAPHLQPGPNIGTGLGRATGSAATGSAATK